MDKSVSNLYDLLSCVYVSSLVLIAAATTPTIEAAVYCYLYLALMGGLAGFVRFLRLKGRAGEWDLRYVSASVLAGSLLSIMFIGVYFQETVIEQFWKCMAISIGVGLFQPDAQQWLNNVLASLLKTTTADRE